MAKQALRRIPLEQLMDLKIDFSFKQIFGKEKNKDITIVFLKALLQKIESYLFNDSEYAIIKLSLTKSY